MHSGLSVLCEGMRQASLCGTVRLPSSRGHHENWRIQSLGTSSPGKNSQKGASFGFRHNTAVAVWAKVASGSGPVFGVATECEVLTSAQWISIQSSGNEAAVFPPDSFGSCCNSSGFKS